MEFCFKIKNVCHLDKMNRRIYDIKKVTLYLLRMEFVYNDFFNSYAILS